MIIPVRARFSGLFSVAPRLNAGRCLRLNAGRRLHSNTAFIVCPHSGGYNRKHASTASQNRFSRISLRDCQRRVS